MNKQKNEERAKFLKEIKEAKEIFRTTQPVLYIGQDIEDKALNKLVDYEEAGIDIYEDEDLLSALKQKIAFQRRQNEEMTKAKRIKAQEEDIEKEYQNTKRIEKEIEEREQEQKRLAIQRSQEAKKRREEQKKIFEQEQQQKEPAIVKDVAGMLKATKQLNKLSESTKSLESKINNLERLIQQEQFIEKQKKEMFRNRARANIKNLKERYAKQEKEELESAFSPEDPFGSAI